MGYEVFIENKRLHTHQKSDNLETIGCSDLDLVGYQDTKRFTYGYIYMLSEGVIFGGMLTSHSLKLPLWKQSS